MEKYRTFWARVGAAIIDGIVLVPVGLIGSAIVAVGQADRAGAVLSAAIAGFAGVFYYVLMHARYGRTLGKMATGVKVVDSAREGPIDFTQSLLRSLPQLIAAMQATFLAAAHGAGDGSIEVFDGLLTGLLSGFYFLDVIVCLASEKRRALHDFVAKTVVVKITP